MNNAVLLRIAASVAFIGTIVVNALANLLPINGLNTGQVSDLYPSLFTPAGVTFSIWSVIYALLTGFIIFCWFRRSDPIITRTLPWFILSCMLNMTWILVWHNLLPLLSVIVMIGLLTTLTYIFKTLHSHNITERKFQVWVLLPFTIYLAWICVATIANLSALLVSFDWQGGFLTADVWTVVMMSIATILALKVMIDYKVPFFSLVVLWAVFGIYLRWKATEHVAIIYSSIVLITILAVGFFYVMRKRTSA